MRDQQQRQIEEMQQMRQQQYQYICPNGGTPTAYGCR
jgi:hypothetical protein